MEPTLFQNAFLYNSNERDSAPEDRQGKVSGKDLAYREEDILRVVILTRQMAIEHAGVLAANSFALGHKVQAQLEGFTARSLARDYDKAAQAQGLLAERVQRMGDFVERNKSGASDYSPPFGDLKRFYQAIRRSVRDLCVNDGLSYGLSKDVNGEIFSALNQVYGNSSVDAIRFSPLNGHTFTITPAQVCANIISDIISDIQSDKPTINDYHASLAKSLARCSILEAVKKDVIEAKASMGWSTDGAYKLNALNQTLEACNAALDICRIRAHTAKQMLLVDKLRKLEEKLHESAHKMGREVHINNRIELSRMILDAQRAAIPINYTAQVEEEGYNAISADAANLSITSLSAENFGRLQRFAEKYQLDDMDRRHLVDSMPHLQAVDNERRKALAGEELIKATSHPIIVAAHHGDIDQLGQLLRDGADPNACDSRGATALMYAGESLQAGAIAKLINVGADANARDNAGHTLKDYLREGLEGAKELLAYAKEYQQRAEQTVGVAQ